MKQPLVLLFSFLVVFTSCKDDKVLPIPEIKIVTGQIEDIAIGTDSATGFLVQVKSPNEKNYHATVLDISKMEDFEIGKKVALKGKLTDNFLEVQKIISTDNDFFSLNGTVQSVEQNESGYTAQVLKDDEVFFATFSISNLGDRYKDFNTGETFTVLGELWLNSNELQLTVQEINN